MAPPSIFRRGKRGMQAPVGPALGEKYVYKDTELRAAIGEVAARYATRGDLTASQGGRIVIADSWKTSGYVIPPQCAGLMITALPGCRLFPSDGPGTQTLFDVRAADVEINRVVAGIADYAFAKLVEAGIGTLNGASVSAERLTVERCTISGAVLYNDASGGLASYAQIIRNRHINTGKTDVIFVDSDSCIVDGNALQALSSILNVLRVGSNGGRCRIVKNDVDHGIIHTSASSGENVIAMNVNTLTITRNPASDEVGMNT
ncbi:MAG: hypothetical protein VW547_10535 [Alphaproteobacteria bacterium]